jgi:hypothetical protein
VLEEAFPVEGSPPDEEFFPGVPPSRQRLSSGSRLAFLVPAFVTEIPFTAEGLLNWDDLSAKVVPTASVQASADRPQLRAPSLKETAIEAPFWLLLSPTEVSSWAHRTDAATSESSGRTELWHTTLASSSSTIPLPDQPPSRQRVVRGVWSRDPGFATFVCSRRSGSIGDRELSEFTSPPA